MPQPQTVALQDVPPYSADVAAKKSPHEPLHFGEKVDLLLKRNAKKSPPVEPSNGNVLAELIGEDNPKVYRAIDGGDPKLSIARKISRALGESLDFLADPSQPIDGRSEDERFASFAASLTPEERGAIVDLFASPGGPRRLLAAHREAIRAGLAARPPRPTGSRG